MPSHIDTFMTIGGSLPSESKVGEVHKEREQG
jgi:hypothetical protein